MPTTSRTVILNSKHRHNARSNPASFSVKLDSQVDANRIATITVKSVSLPHLFPNVAGNKARLYVTVGGMDYVVTIPEGQYYLPADFLAACVTAIDAAVGPGTVTSLTMDPFTYRVSCVFTVAARFWTHTEIEQSTGLGDSANAMLGAAYAYEGTHVAQTSFTMPGVLNLAGITELHLCSDTLAASHALASDGSINSTLLCVPIAVPYGSWIQWISPSAELSSVDLTGSHPPLTSIDFNLRDADNNDLSLPVNVHCEVVLLVHYRAHDDY